MHGGNLRRAKELYGLETFIDLSANINPFGPPARVWDSLEKGMPDIVHYPDPESINLRKTLAGSLSLALENIMVGNGAGELIFTIMQALKPQKVVIPIPTFSEYERAAGAVGSEVLHVPFGPEGWTRFKGSDKETLEIWKGILKGCDLLFLCSPHNPTGSVIDKDFFEYILRITKDGGCKILFDESFLDFLPDECRKSARQYLAGNEHLIVLYSLTKFYSIPGLRLGAVFAHPSLITNFDQYRDPWSVNVFAQQAGIAALEDLEYPSEVRGKIQESRGYFYREFEQSSFPDLKLWPSAVNFALIQVFNHPTKALIEHLGRLGILVRDCSSFEGLHANFIRVAIKDIPVMQRLIEGVKDWSKRSSTT
ncbi:PLP-dependent enzyme, histidinol-phosphate/aromatic aminotransferase or cobyric acid decarboxylase [Desulfosporosinus orientis DSM 765]|uniref:Aminotransferase n=1 Tax=Desulfosporosinus orientis (strain ATCC 19365 / DSM 765 / NCIMB 8382 / VKM B-1628 / Singapore I) TaxID=768706 RepID=G7WDL1_DESOD|nr:threonine-phosphate decarboxylase [Desulfosporosinus orientis]AET68336.1 PLP-dependent enzyme, histidinol-phosphate/aromatic aminotransferase or cobyric acid decarboxylase [Desulfosporosinus orientis DSM 765]